MSDPIGLSGLSGGGGMLPPRQLASPGTEDGPGFKDVLRQQIETVNTLQQDAKEAVEDIVSGRRDDIESVMLATRKADSAFKLLLQIRNQVMEAYDEVKQLRI